ncbi:RNA recognition motif domain-containing protein [Paraliomyxa miuraensis]|uniref:RNA recognition motif domain-containing protein n=1 Tax=Paraliomyxa miuraensis TaxID=376150 RepID=UPI002250BB21|nr:RNA-binding protein [Paraliomyxa miuraensis]
MNQRLFVGNLAFQTTEEGLRAAFEEFGVVTDAKIITDRETGRSRGFAFLTMGSDEDAKKAIEGMNGAMVDGRALRVNEAEERRPRAGGGGGGGGGFGDRPRGGGGGGGGFGDRPRRGGGGGGGFGDDRGGGGRGGYDDDRGGGRGGFGDDRGGGRGGRRNGGGRRRDW